MTHGRFTARLALAFGMLACQGDAAAAPGTRIRIGPAQLRLVTPPPPTAADSQKIGLRATEVPPVSLSKTLQNQTDDQRAAVAAAIEADVQVLTVRLNELLAMLEKTQAVTLQIDELNAALSAKREAYDFTLGKVTPVSNAAAESYVAINNPYFLMCGDAVWTPKDPLNWTDQINPRKGSLVRSGRSVGLLTQGDLPKGTAFVVGRNHILTNVHVLKELGVYNSRTRTWQIPPNTKVKFDVEYPFGEGSACDKPNHERSYYVNGVYAVSQAGDDIAVLITSRDNDFPEALTISHLPDERYAGNLVVAVIGYPGPPNDMTVAEQMEFFRTPTTSTPQFPYKRLSQGYTGDRRVTPEGYFVHKANTSRGNSGSPIFNLADGKVVGVHVQGYSQPSRFSDVLGYNEGLTGQRVLALLRQAGLVP